LLQYVEDHPDTPMTDVAARFGCSTTAVRYHLARSHSSDAEADEDDESPSAIPPSTLARREEIATWVENHEMEGGEWDFTARSLVLDLDLDVSPTTVRRDLASLDLVWRRDGWAPNSSSPEWAARRLAFAKEWLARGLSADRLVFTDECMVRAIMPRISRWQRKGAPRRRVVRERWAPSVHIFGLIAVDWRRLVRLPHKGSGLRGGITSADFVVVMRGILTELKRALVGRILVLDGASIHKSSVTVDFFKKHKIEVLAGWPPHSPDLNPIENFWAELKRRCGGALGGLEKPTEGNREAVWEVVKATASGIPRETIATLVESFATRCQRVVELGGAYTGY
jgi:hypothetical protein